MQWLEHKAFTKEVKALKKKYPRANDAVKYAKRLIEGWIDCPSNPPIDPGKLHRVTQSNEYEVWKLEMAVPNSGLRQNQWPRVWFAIEKETLALLLLAVHQDSYDNNAMDKEAIQRYEELR